LTIVELWNSIVFILTPKTWSFGPGFFLLALFWATGLRESFEEMLICEKLLWQWPKAVLAKPPPL
jgi:hypothetical protein